MKKLYYSIIPRHDVDPEDMQDDPTVLAHLGTTISDGKPIICKLPVQY
jgi:hypothetical protein